MEIIDSAYRLLLFLCLAFLSVAIILCLFRAVLGPRFTDRVVSVNIILTKSIIMIAILSYLFGEGALVDIAIVYAMIGFLAVVVLSKCYLMPHHTNPADPPHNFGGRQEEKEAEQ